MVMMKGQVSLPDNNGEFPCICHVESGGEDPGGLLALGHELPLQLQDGVERVRVLVRQPDLPPQIYKHIYRLHFGITSMSNGKVKGGGGVPGQPAFP